MKLPIKINTEHGIPIYVQLEEQIRFLIHKGNVKVGEMMPTVRELAVQLHINSNTVARVYRDLQREGILELKRGVGTFVAVRPKFQPLASAASKRLERQVDKLIALAKKLNFKPVELSQLIRTRWEEKK